MQTIVEFNPGTHTVTLPADATNIVGEALGSGAPGSPGSESMCGSGGNGGWYASRDLSMLAGQTVQVVVPVDGSATTINAGGGIDMYAPGGASPSGVNLPNAANGYLVANAGGSGGTDSNGRAGTGGQPGHEYGGGLGGVSGGGEERLPGAAATNPGQGGDGGGLNSAGGLGGPGWARLTYDVPDPVEPPPPDPEPPVVEYLMFVAIAGGALAVGTDKGSTVPPEEVSALAGRLNSLYLER